MATSSSDTDDIHKGCDYAFDFECQPCSRLGYNNEAEHFCEDCKQYLCKRCSAYHQVLPVTQKHELITVEEKQYRLDDERAIVFTNKLNDNEDMWIIGVAMMPGNKIVLALKYCEKLKVYDVSTNHVLSELKLQRAPNSVTIISDDTIATTVPDTGKIVLARTVPKLAKAGEINVNGESFELSYNADKGWLAVSFKMPSKLEIMDLTGRVLRTIGNGGDQRLVDGPGFVSFAADNKSLFVACCSGVVKVGLDGNVLATYRDDSLWADGMVASSTGEIYVTCTHGRSRFSMHVISPDCKKIKRRNIKLVYDDDSPDIEFHRHGLCLNEPDAILYIATYGRGLVQAPVKSL